MEKDFEVNEIRITRTKKGDYKFWVDKTFCGRGGLQEITEGLFCSVTNGTLQEDVKQAYLVLCFYKGLTELKKEEKNNER